MDLREQQKNAAANAAGLRKKRIIAVIVAAVVICGVAALFVRAFVRDSRANSGYYMRNSVVMSNDKVSVDAAMMSYFIYNKVNGTLGNYYSLYKSYYYTQYGTFAAFIKDMAGIDLSVSLKTQYRSSATWFDYFKDLAEKDVKTYVALYGKAVESGMSLSEDDLASIRMRAESVDLSGYGTGLAVGDVENALKLQTLADMYKYGIEQGIGIGDDELNGYLDENYTDYTYVDYLMYPVEYMTEKSPLTQDKAKALADRLAAAKNRTEFESIIAETVGEDEADETVKDCVYTKKAYAESEVMMKLFDKEMNVYDTYTAENTTDAEQGAYYVYMLLKKPYTDEERTVDLRHILISSYEEDDAKKAEAERIYKLFTDSDGSEEAFAALARRYSEDESSLYKGGLYERVQKGGSTASVFDDWCFGTERKPGDCEVVYTSYGYHVMYFVGYGTDNSHAAAYDDLLNEKLTAEIDALLESDAVSVNGEAYDTINI
ncbi:MAG: peptidylprolyl isomerase [Clostridia bacterium]|nr:peptidylprolyl isomerase [Clostridia bacterium]